jgi:hypothetical protein
MKSPNDKDLRTMFAPVRGARRGTTNVALNIQWPGDDPVSEMDFYAEAYHRAGRKLFDAIPKNDDYWFFSFDACPIIFLYWHALELHLKDAVVKGNSVMAFREKPAAFKGNVFSSHDLMPLLEAVEKIVCECGWKGKGDTGSLLGARAVIEEFTAVFPRVAGLYPVGTKGEASIDTGLTFDLRSVVDRLDPLLRYLSDVGSALEAELDDEQDFLSHET